MRKTLTYTVDAEGRDKGKAFLITELSAAAAEEWAIQAFLALASAGVEFPDEVKEMGFSGIASASLGALGKIDYNNAKPLLDKMMTCVKIIPDPAKPNVVRNLIEEDIEEVSTRLQLRKQVMALHTDFFATAAR